MKKKDIYTISMLFFFILLLSLDLSAQSVFIRPAIRDTILVEIGDITITTMDVQQRINSLPLAQRPYFRTVAGQNQLLETMKLEQILYKRALEIGIDRIPRVHEEITNTSNPVILQLYIREALKEELDFNPTSIELHYHEGIDLGTPAPRAMLRHLPTREKMLEMGLETPEEIDDILDNSTDVIVIERSGVITHDIPIASDTSIHFFNKSDFDAAIERPFSVLRDEIELSLIHQREQELYLAHIDNLSNRYNVEVDREILKNLGIGVIRLPGLESPTRFWGASSITAPEELRDEIAIQSSNPEVRMTLLDVEDVLRHAASRDLILNEFDTPERREMIVLADLDTRLINAAIKDDDFVETIQNNFEMRMVRQEIVLDNFEELEIIQKIEVTDEEISEYYEIHKHEDMAPERRLIRQFISLDLRDARRHHRTIARMLRRNQHDLIVDYIVRESYGGQTVDLIEVSKARVAIPRVGADEIFWEKVFEARIGQLSDIFQNMYDEYVFFFIVDIIPEDFRSLSELENQYRSTIQRQKETALLREIESELIDAYNVVSYPERLVSTNTPEELFYHVDISINREEYGDTIFFLNCIISDFKGSEHAYQALFMKAFILTEYINDNVYAIQTLNEMIEDFPSGDLNQDALLLIETLTGNQ